METRKHLRMRWVKLIYKEVAFYKNLSNEDVGKRVRDLLEAMESSGICEYPENQAAIDEAEFYRDLKHDKITEWNEQKKRWEAKNEQKQ